MKLYVSTNGDDKWSGRRPEPSADRTDGPYRTLERTKREVRALKASAALPERLVVELRGGVYRLEEPIVFGPDDSAPVHYTSYPGETAILDGGRRITGWREVRLGDAIAWTADVPEVREGAWYFRQLFVNGERRSRPRLPKQGFYWMESVPGTTFADELFKGSRTFRYAGDDIRNWSRLEEIDVVVPHFWTDEHMPLQSVDEENRLATSSRQSVFVLKDDFVERYPKYFLDNVFEALSEPGEWYLDRPSGQLYYLPMPGETPETCEVTAPYAKQLLALQGNPAGGEFVEFLAFSRLVFQHTDWDWVERPADPRTDPNVRYAAGPQGASHLPGVVSMRGARFCAVESCTIRRVGWYGVELGEGCHGIRVAGNDIYDLGAGGVKVGGADADGPRALRSGGHRIEDNHIRRGGRVFLSGIGVLLMHSGGNVVAHNRIHDLYYSGISSGWVWGYEDNVSRNNQIENNHIFDLGHGVLSDMGGIYLLGVQPGTVVRGNLIHDIEKSNYGGWGIYTDEGSSHVLIENNVVYNAHSQGFHQHYGRENVVRNNVFAFNREGQVAMTRKEEHIAFTFLRNIVLTRNEPMFAMRLDYGSRIVSDANVFWDAGAGDEARWFGLPGEEGGGRDEWVAATGNDRHSVVADPGFGNAEEPAAARYRLKADSPALALGFRPIDLTNVGPRNGRKDEG